MSKDVFEIEAGVLKSRLVESELFSRRFGSFSKSDYEVLMFTVYLDSLDGYVRDYEISLALGITESKVRNLRLKSQLLYPREINWIEELEHSIQHGYYDDVQRQITITIEDPSVHNLLKNIIEENFGVVGLTLNKKQLVLPIESFIMLAAVAEQDKNKIIKNLNTLLMNEIGSRKKIEKESLQDRFLKGVPDVVSFMGVALSLFETGQPIVRALIEIMNI